MKTVILNRLSIIIFSILLLSGCQTNPEKQLLATDASQVQLRNIQTRAFDSNDKEMLLRTTISTLQDLGFVLDNADFILGSVSGTRYGKAKQGPLYELKMTVTVRNRSEEQLLVRANAQYNLTAIDDPEPYQDFFTSLEKSLFLTAHNVD